MKILNYNATVEHIKFVHDELCILRVKPDETCAHYEPGQYLTLGLYDHELRVDADRQPPVPEIHKDHTSKIILRAYSVSCTMLDPGQLLLPCQKYDYQEYYISKVNLPDDWDHQPPRPRLTPRLFNLTAGSRIYTTVKPKGTYTLGNISPDRNIIFAATGTGEAPHNAMLVDLLSKGHRGKIVSMCCVRYRKDSGYFNNHQILMQRYPNYQYKLYTTREPENLDPQNPGYVGKQYLQKLFTGEEFIKECGWQPSPSDTSIYLCGNPDMIGIPHEEADGTLSFPQSGGQTGVVEILMKQGYTLSHHHHAGNIHYEKYW